MSFDTHSAKPAEQSWQSGYGRDAIPSYRLPLVYKDKYDAYLIWYHKNQSSVGKVLFYPKSSVGKMLFFLKVRSEKCIFASEIT